MGKIKIDKFSNPGSPTGSHLWPVIDFLIQQGNIPHTKSKEFYSDKTGVGEFYFYGPIDPEAILKRFEFPDSIKVVHSDHYGGGVVWDLANALIIFRSR
jgi:hypothetical protein